MVSIDSSYKPDILRKIYANNKNNTTIRTALSSNSFTPTDVLREILCKEMQSGRKVDIFSGLLSDDKTKSLLRRNIDKYKILKNMLFMCISLETCKKSVLIQLSKRQDLSLIEKIMYRRMLKRVIF